MADRPPNGGAFRRRMGRLSRYPVLRLTFYMHGKPCNSYAHAIPWVGECASLAKAQSLHACILDMLQPFTHILVVESGDTYGVVIARQRKSSQLQAESLAVAG